MGKFKINLELQGFKLNVEGEREDLPAIRRELQDRLTLLTPSAALLSAEEPVEKPAVATEVPTKKQKRRTASPAAAAQSAPPINLSHDVEKFGHPRQAWTKPNKAIWLLYIVSAQGGPNQLSGSAISATFNKYFKDSGLLSTSHVNRDLAQAKAKTPSQVNTDMSTTPPEWFLTTEGKKIGERLVGEALGGDPS